jgi:class 3 adenylate cyclase
VVYFNAEAGEFSSPKETPMPEVSYSPRVGIDRAGESREAADTLFEPTERALFIERTGVKLRWVLIVVCSFIELAITPIIPLPVYSVALPFAIAYNLGIQLIIRDCGVRIRIVSALTAAGDILVSAVLIYFGGGNDLYLWYFVLLVSHAARFGFAGSIISPLAFSALYILGLWLRAIDIPASELAMRTTFLVTAGLVSGYLARAEKARFLTILREQKETLLAQRKREEMRSVLQRYVSYNVVEELLKNPESLCVGGVRKRITVLFSDIQGFTSLLSTTEPEEVVIILNEYLAEMTEIVFAYGGMVDKFVGDAIIAIFGGIACRDDDSSDAVRCGLSMQKRLSELQDKWRKSSRFVFNSRIGVCSGDAIMGNIGSPARMDYTAIGDAVNTASRLQSVAEINTVVVSRSTYDEVRELFDFESLGEILLKGKTEPIGVYKVQGEKSA